MCGCNNFCLRCGEIICKLFLFGLVRSRVSTIYLGTINIVAKLSIKLWHTSVHGTREQSRKHLIFVYRDHERRSRAHASSRPGAVRLPPDLEPLTPDPGPRTPDSGATREDEEDRARWTDRPTESRTPESPRNIFIGRVF